jgi:Flp pilus assembly pilin Flp
MMRHAITFQRDAGQTMAEYALVLGVITLVIVATISLLSGQIEAAFLRTVDIVRSAG